MATDNPLVSILLAVYKPNHAWLEEQLNSIDNQTYSNIELIVWDDCPDDPVDERIIAKCITQNSYKLFRGSKNLGSNGAFEELTKLSSGRYLAYCDQDDVWNCDKVERMIDFLQKDQSYSLVCSDMQIIDQNGRITNNSIKDIRKRHVFREGAGLAKYLLVSNFVTGCAMMVKADIAKKAVPFTDCLVHDQWIAIIAALNGKIGVIYDPLLKYRQHGNNQTGILTGVKDKQSYYEIRLIGLHKRISDLSVLLNDYDEVSQTINELLIWIRARIEYFNHPNIYLLRTMLKFKHFGEQPILIERVLPFIPNWAFKKFVSLAQKGVI